jgi:hypothetical protein
MPTEIQKPPLHEIKYNRLLRKYKRQLIVNEGLIKKVDRLEKELGRHNATQGEHIAKLVRYTVEHVFSNIRFAPTIYDERKKFDPPKSG